MFIELHLSDNNEKITLNVNNIISIYQIHGKVNIHAGKVVYLVNENYEDIIETIQMGLQAFN